MDLQQIFNDARAAKASGEQTSPADLLAKKAAQRNHEDLRAANADLIDTLCREIRDQWEGYKDELRECKVDICGEYGEATRPKGYGNFRNQAQTHFAPLPPGFIQYAEQYTLYATGNVDKGTIQFQFSDVLGCESLYHLELPLDQVTPEVLDSVLQEFCKWMAPKL